MDSLIGISVRGKTYLFSNTFSKKQMFLIKKFVTNYNKKNLLFEKDDNIIIKQFIYDANKLLKLSLQLVNIEEVLVLK